MIDMNDALQLIIERRTEIKEECIEEIKFNSPSIKIQMLIENFPIIKHDIKDQELKNMKTKLIQLANRTRVAIDKPDTITCPF
jgi:hypothetical protein